MVCYLQSCLANHLIWIGRGVGGRLNVYTVLHNFCKMIFLFGEWEEKKVVLDSSFSSEAFALIEDL